MAHDPSAAPAGGPSRNPHKRESAGSALMQIAIAIVLVAAAVFVYWKVQGEKARVADLAVKAREATQGDDAVALLKAEKLYMDIGDEAKVLKDDAILAQLAELEAQLYQAYGVEGAKAKAEKYVAMAKDRDVRKAERYAAEAYLLLGQGKAVEAEQGIMAVLDRGGRHGKLLHALAVAKLAQGKAKEAVVAALEGEKIANQLVRLPITEGDALLEQANFGAAKAAYKKALALNGNHLRARAATNLALAVSREGKPSLIEKELDRLLEEANTNHGGNPPPRVKGFIQYAKGEVFLVDNDAEHALEQANAALVTDPSEYVAVALKARALAKLGKLDEAKKAFNDALALAPSSIPIARQAAETLGRAGQAAEGVEYLEKVKATNPDNGLLYVYLTLAQAKAGKGKDALKTADIAIDKLGNASDVALFAKAKALQADGQIDKAREAYGEALGAHGSQDWAEVFYELGNIRAHEKLWDDAAKAYEQAIKSWDKTGGSIDDVADAYEAEANAYKAAKKPKPAKEAADKAAELRKGTKA
jgi:tetratricopeptide (TPR) repeat protein